MCLHFFIHPYNEPMRSFDPLSSFLLTLLFSLQILYRGLNRILRQHRTVKFHGWQLQMICNIRILNRQNFIDSLTLDPLGGDGGRGDGRSASKGFEFGFDDVSCVVYFNLELHYVSACGGAHEAL